VNEFKVTHTYYVQADTASTAYYVSVVDIEIPDKVTVRDMDTTDETDIDPEVSLGW